MAHKFIIYKAKDGWRWRLKASNNKIVAESGEAYTRAYSARKAIHRLQDLSVAVGSLFIIKIEEWK